METLLEQRKQQRTDISWPVCIWIPAANRFINGQSCNISKSGAYLKMPITTPLRPGHMVEINFPRTLALAKKKGQFARIKRATVVRVERGNILRDANIGVAVSFE